MEVTSALANKLIKGYTDELDHLVRVEGDSYSYTEVAGQQPIIPDYNFLDMQKKIDDLNRKIIKLKHAVSVFNTTYVIEACDMTVDQVLVRMAQLNKLKSKYQQMRNLPEKKLNRGYGSSQVTEYTCRNFKAEEAEAAYNDVVSELRSLQLNLDLCNSTICFEVDIEM